jgi:ACS family sodium-dependent inorganic phosphate cotransporter
LVTTRFNAFSVNHLDIAPQHAGVLMGLSNMAGTLPGIISPLVTGFVVQNKVP